MIDEEYKGDTYCTFLLVLLLIAASALQANDDVTKNDTNKVFKDKTKKYDTDNDNVIVLFRDFLPSQPTGNDNIKLSLMSVFSCLICVVHDKLYAVCDRCSPTILPHAE